jgi:hypothetical protein
LTAAALRGTLASVGQDISALEQVRGLRDFWQRGVRRESAPPGQWMGDRLLRDAVGIGIEQAAVQLAEAPSFADFLAWIIATAGAPDPVTIARYHAALDGSAPPAETAADLAAIDVAPEVLDAADLRHWHEHGYVVLRGAIGPSEAAAAAAFVWRAASADPNRPASWYGAAHQGMMVQRFQHPSLEPARRSLRIHKAFAQLWGDSDLWCSVDRVSLNPPETVAHPFRAPRLHWDVSLVPPIPFATQGVLYLTDTSAEQGALELVPGFHHRIHAWLADLPGDADPRAIDLRGEAIRVPGSAGDLVIWRQDLPHGASPNRTERPRLAQYLNYYSPRMTEQAAWR